MREAWFLLNGVDRKISSSWFLGQYFLFPFYPQAVSTLPGPRVGRSRQGKEEEEERGVFCIGKKQTYNHITATILTSTNCSGHVLSCFLSLCMLPPLWRCSAKPPRVLVGRWTPRFWALKTGRGGGGERGGWGDVWEHAGATSSPYPPSSVSLCCVTPRPPPLCYGAVSSLPFGAQAGARRRRRDAWLERRRGTFRYNTLTLPSCLSLCDM